MHQGHRDRLRQRIIEYGFESLFPHEFLEFILFAALPRRDTNALAHSLIKHFGTFSKIFDASVSELMAVEGVGEKVALHILSYSHHSKIMRMKDKPKVIKNLFDARSLFASYMEFLTKEEFHMILLDKGGHILKHVIVTDHDSSSVELDTQKLLVHVRLFMPVSVIIAHNHPTKDVEPSSDDVNFTRKFAKILKVGFNVQVFEHLIFGSDGKCFSFRNSGHLETLD